MIVDPRKTNELIERESAARRELAAATAAIEAEITRQKARRDSPTTSPGVKAALTKNIGHLERREQRWTGYAPVDRLRGLI